MKSKLQTSAIYFLILSLFIFGCGPASSAPLAPDDSDADPTLHAEESATPSSTAAPVHSPTVTLTPLPTATLSLPLTIGTGIPQTSNVISPENVDSIVEIARWTGHGCSVFSLSFSPNSQMLASTSCDQTVRLWEVATGGELPSLGHLAVEFGSAFLPDSNTLVLWSNDNTITLYDVLNGSELRTFEHTARLYGAAVSPDGKTLAAGGADGMVTLWDIASDGRLPSLDGNLGEKYGSPLVVYRVAFSPDGATLASTDEDEKIRLWDLASGSVLRTIEVQDARSATFSMDGSVLVVETARLYNQASDSEYIVKLYDVAIGGRLRNFSGDPDKGHDWAFSPDGRLLAIAVGTYECCDPAADGAIVLYDVASGRELRRLTGHTDLVSSIAFSSDGRFIASGSADGDRTIRLWGIYP